MPDKITEAEMLSVLLGEADRETDARVRQAALTDHGAAREWHQWSRLCQVAMRDTDWARDVARKTNQSVMKQLPALRLEKEADLPEPPRFEVLYESVVCFFLGDAAGPRRRGVVVAAAAAIACFLLLIPLLGGLTPAPTDQWVASVHGGEALVTSPGANESAKPLQNNQVLKFPSRIQVKRMGELKLNVSNAVAVHVRSIGELELLEPKRLRQISGVVDYRVEAPPSEDRVAHFTVDVPQGQIVDLGTAFQVAVGPDDQTRVRVREGRVKLLPRRGVASELIAGEEAVLMSNRVMAAPLGAGNSPPDTPPLSEDVAAMAYQPETRLLAADDRILSLLEPQVLILNRKRPERLGQAPTFTTEPPLMGMLRIRIDGVWTESIVACDKKINDKWRIYVDRNHNGDLTDDPIYEEGVDFLPGKVFPVGLGRFDKMLWFRRPVQTVPAPPAMTTTHTVVVEDRLEYFNRLYLAGPVELPATLAGAESTKRMLLLLDSDADGDFLDEEGRIGIWARPAEEGGIMDLTGMAPINNQRATYLGRQWTITRVQPAGYRAQPLPATAAPIRPIQVGDPLPKIQARTLRGKTIGTEPPEEGYLLIYTTAAWLEGADGAACRALKALYSRFRQRGLAVMGVSVDFRSTHARQIMDQWRQPWDVIYNGPDFTEGPLAQLGITNVPESLLIDPAGYVIHIGRDFDEIADFLEKTLPSES